MIFFENIFTIVVSVVWTQLYLKHMLILSVSLVASTSFSFSPINDEINLCDNHLDRCHTNDANKRRTEMIVMT